jgi:hypothetical protein
MNEDDVRRIVREEIVKAFQVFGKTSEPDPLEDLGQFERLILGLLSVAIDATVEEIGESDNGTHPECPECDHRVGKEPHASWCSHGA